MSIIRAFDGNFEIALRYPEKDLKDKNSLKFQSQTEAINKALSGILSTLKLSKNKAGKRIVSLEDAQFASKAVRKIAIQSNNS